MRPWMIPWSGFALVALALFGHGPAMALAAGHWAHATYLMGPPIEG